MKLQEVLVMGRQKLKKGYKSISLAKAKKMFPEAIKAMEADPDECIFWTDPKGRLHCDDAVHPAFDDMWDVKSKEWVGSDDEGPLDEALWSGSVQTKWHPGEGFFKKSAASIASGLKKASKDLKQAMGRLNFYVNRAGKNLSADDKARLGQAKVLLRKAFNAE